MAMFHPKLSSDKVFVLTDEKSCSYLSDNGIILNVILKIMNVIMKFWSKKWKKEQVVKTRKVLYGMFVSFLGC